jgi:hypothetical protein
MPGAQFDEAYPMIHNYFGGYAIAGWTNSFGVGMDDFHLLALDPLGNRPVCVLEAFPPYDTLFYHMPIEMEQYEFRPELDSMPIIDTIVEETDICPVVDIKNAPSEPKTKTENEIQIKGSVIEFTLKNRSKIHLQIFNLAGRYIKTLAQGHFDVGTYRLNLPTEFEPGIYFINLQIEKGSSLTVKYIKF